ncbi:apolipoprotein N-acyltransferase [bacterium]|nr:apolipoprotein N-acyltransferase [bacterium]
MVLRLICAILAGLLLAAASPLSLPEIPLPEPWGTLALGIPGWHAEAGFGQVAWLAFVALIPLLEAAKNSKSRLEAFGLGYLAGLAWLIPHWIWLISFGWLPVILLAAWFALPVGLVALAMKLIIDCRRPALVVWGIPAVWTGIEFLRSFGFWAFPWNLLGYTQAHQLPLIQVADLGGVYAIGFLIVLANTAGWAILSALGPLRYRLGHALAAGAVLLLVLAYGEWRLSEDYKSYTQPALNIALVQGGVDTFERWSDDRLQRSLDAYVPLSAEALDHWDVYQDREESGRFDLPGPRRMGEMLVVWPESALPRSMDPRRPERVPYEVQNLIDDHENSALLTGAIGRPTGGDESYNGCLLIGGGDDLRWPYSKVRLVPYGEVVPLREVARFLDYPWGDYDLSGGESLAPLRWRGHVLGLGVCFDNVFSFLARGQVKQGAGGLVLVTNNSWYQLASGIRQHCDMDILRAVEFRRPLARVSTTGWSHLISPSGRILTETAPYSSGLIEAVMWPGDTQSAYLRFGDLFALLCLLAGSLVVLGAAFAGPSEGIL